VQRSLPSPRRLLPLRRRPPTTPPPQRRAPPPPPYRLTRVRLCRWAGAKPSGGWIPAPRRPALMYRCHPVPPTGMRCSPSLKPSRSCKGGLWFAVAVRVGVTLILFALLVAKSQRTCVASVSTVSSSHRAVACRHPTRCFRCLEPGHHSYRCPCRLAASKPPRQLPPVWRLAWRPLPASAPASTMSSADVPRDRGDPLGGGLVVGAGTSRVSASMVLPLHLGRKSRGSLLRPLPWSRYP
jgi:hypothetical protein